MHKTAYNNCQHFYNTYIPNLEQLNPDFNIVEIGSQNVNGSLRSIWPSSKTYTGIDFVEGNGVDVVLTDPYSLPIESESVDVILSSSVFEHSELFWLLFLEIMRVLKPHGLFYLNAPSNGDFHRYPVDCYRFYPDSGRALVTWAKRNNVNAMLLESYTSAQDTNDRWNDFVAVFLKDEEFANNYQTRIINNQIAFSNALSSNSDGVINYSSMTEDQKRLLVISQVVSRQITVI